MRRIAQRRVPKAEGRDRDDHAPAHDVTAPGSARGSAPIPAPASGACALALDPAAARQSIVSVDCSDLASDSNVHSLDQRRSVSASKRPDGCAWLTPGSRTHRSLGPEHISIASRFRQRAGAARNARVPSRSEASPALLMKWMHTPSTSRSRRSGYEDGRTTSAVGTPTQCRQVGERLRRWPGRAGWSAERSSCGAIRSMIIGRIIARTHIRTAERERCARGFHGRGPRRRHCARSPCATLLSTERGHCRGAWANGPTIRDSRGAEVGA